jgi:hypothetical protein
MLVEFVTFSSDQLSLPNNQEIHITLLGVPTNERITTGAFDPSNKTIRVIVQNRHYIDWIRTIAHELVHLQQAVNGKLVGEIAEIGGEIEDTANLMSGRIIKSYLKNVLTKEQKEKLGLGSF